MMATVTFETGGSQALPDIGPAAEHAVIPLVRQSYIDPSTNRFGGIQVSGVPMRSEISSSVVAASMSFSSTQVGQFSMTIVDSPDGTIIGSGLFAQGTSIDWGDQHLDVRSIDFRPGGGGPQVTVKARSRVISTLKGPEHSGKGSWGDQDVTYWVLERCREAGAIPVVQGDLGRLTFTRQEYDAKETTWDVMVKAAKTVGCWCYEFEQIVTFMRPSALASLDRAREWHLYWVSPDSYSDGLGGFPAYSWSLDSSNDGSVTESLSFDLISGDADLARPGDAVVLDGNVGAAFGGWVVTDVTIPLSITAAVKVTCARVIDPAPTAVSSA